MTAASDPVVSVPVAAEAVLPDGGETMRLMRAIAVARGEEPADLVIRGGQVVNVFSGDIHSGDIAIAAGRIVGVGAYEGKECFDAAGLFIAPGFIDGHIHIESTMLTPGEFARAVVPLGTTAVVADPHEIANVLGLEGITYMLDCSRDLPLSVFFMLPPCVPTTAMETSGARLSARELAVLLAHPQVLGVGEMMNYPGLLAREPDVLEKLEIGRNRCVDGHAPGLLGRDLNAYVGAGITSDHECTTAAEAIEKLRAGMQVMIREGSVAKNLEAVLPVVTPLNAWRFGLVSDDRHPTDLVAEGHVNGLLRKAVGLGLSPITAVQMVSINPAVHFHLDRLGAVAPGYRADLVLLEDLSEFRAKAVFKNGRQVAADGCLTVALAPPAPVHRDSIHIGWAAMSGLEIRAEGQVAKVIDLVPGGIITRKVVLPVTVRDGVALADPARDLCKLAVVERHRATGNVGLGFVRGFGLRAGALASSVAHDSHNIVAVGTNDADILEAIRAVEYMHGGIAAVASQQLLAAVALPIAGLMSDQPLERVVTDLRALLRASHDLGSALTDPFMTLSFLALPVVPSLRLTDHGLVDVDRFRLVPLFGEE